jgi:phosphate transport system protein
VRPKSGFSRVFLQTVTEHGAQFPEGENVPRIHFQQQLAALKDKLLAMAALSQQAVRSSVDAYLQRDAGLSQYVRENETAINAAQREVDEMAYELLAQEQPMAIDLRFILAVIKINGDLERVGDQSMSIAIRAQEMLEEPAVELDVDIGRMGEHAVRMIRCAIQSLLDADAQFAESVVAMDDEIDRMNRMARESLMATMEQRPEISLQALNAIIIARALERIADHATNIARDVVFWIRGADIRHQVSTAVD